MRALAVESRITISIFTHICINGLGKEKINRALEEDLYAHIKKYGKAVARNEREEFPMSRYGDSVPPASAYYYYYYYIWLIFCTYEGYPEIKDTNLV